MNRPRFFRGSPSTTKRSANAPAATVPSLPSWRTTSAPIKVAEFLACGRPVVVSAGLGDMPALVRENRCGVVVGEGEDVDRAAEELCALLDDPELAARCRSVAEQHFDVDRAVDRLVSIYAAIADVADA